MSRRRGLLAFPALQFLLVLPTLAVVAVVVASAAVGIDHPGINFGAVFTWTVWWGALLLSFAVLGRAWCLVCPIGAIGEWVQRTSLWWRSSAAAGLGRRWPRRFRGMGLATALFVLFVFLDSGYGMSNSPRMTAALVIVLTLAAAWVDFFFERRAFCRYVCPLTTFIGLNALVAGFELRRRTPGVCHATCTTKDCYRGNDHRWGCPMSEFPGGPMDNRYCILCTECVKSCAHDNVALRFRPPGIDLWAARRPGVDGAVAATAIVGTATVVPLLTVTLLPGLRGLLAPLVPPGSPPNDPPRLLALALLFAAGLATSGGLMWGAATLSSLAAGTARVGTHVLVRTFAYAFLPIGLARLMAEFADHAARASSTVLDATRALLLDFPLNRVPPNAMGAAVIVPPAALYALQAVLLLAALALCVGALDRAARRLWEDRETAIAALVPMAALALALTLIGLWTLAAPLS